MIRRLRNWTFIEVSKFLKLHGFVLHGKATGSHFHYKKITTERSFLVILAYHGNKGIIPPGTMNSIVRQSGINKKVWENHNK